MKKNFIVLDTEGMSGGRPYNIGYIVANSDGKIIAQRSFACLPCVMENLNNSLKSSQKEVTKMTHKNIEEILCNPHKYQWCTISNVKDALISDITEYDISEIWAYNVTFDKGEINRLFNDDIMHELSIEWLDIWSAVVMTKCLTKKFVKFCKKNNFLTEKGNCKTSAEVVYAYMTKNIDFKEEHTALEDCKIELELLLWAKKTKKKIDGTVKNPWRLVKNFCEVNGL